MLDFFFIIKIHYFFEYQYHFLVIIPLLFIVFHKKRPQDFTYGRFLVLLKILKLTLGIK